MRIATKISEYAIRYLPVDERTELEEMLPSEVMDSNETNGMNEPLIILINSGETIHESMVIIENI